MIYLLAIFAFGIILGWILKKQKHVVRFSSKLTFFSVLSLLFLLGYQAGVNPDIKAHFNTIGLKAMVISILSVSGSIVFVTIFSRFILKK